jgi:flavin-dependent dehydrogenase
MAQRLKEVDVVVIGVGMVGTMFSKELASAGYKAARGPLSRRAVIGIHRQRTQGVSRWVTEK